MLHLVVTLFNATQQSINQQVVRCWEENILKNELASGFWRKSNRFVKVVYPSASESGLFRLFWSQVFGEVLARVKAICHNPCLLPASSDFWFLLSLFWHQILHCHRNGKWNQQSFCRINVVSQNGGINIPPVHRNSCHLVLFPPACLKPTNRMYK